MLRGSVRALQRISFEPHKESSCRCARKVSVTFMQLENAGWKVCLEAGVLIACDGRGHHTTRPHAVDNAVKERAREHIASFPRSQSHYSRSSNHNISKKA